MNRTRPALIRSAIACLALIVCAGPASAELAVHELEQQPLDSEIADFFTLGQGDLFLRMRDHREPRSVVYVLTADGEVKERTELPSGMDGLFVPYRNGFATQRIVSGDSLQIVAYERAADLEPKVLYESRAPFHSPRLYATPDGQDLYVMEAGEESQITRIDSRGQIAWQKTARWIDSSTFLATDDGVAFAQYASPQNPAMVLRALDREGRQRWETPLAARVSDQSIYSAAGFLTLRTHADSAPGRNEQRPMNFDARSGELTADVFVDPFAFATGTKDGLLISGQMQGQSYVATLDGKGKYVWLRRYATDQKVSDIQQAAATRDGKLAFVTRPRVITTTTPTTSIIVTDGEAASLGRVHTGCLDPEWQEAVALATQLRGQGVWVPPPWTAEREKGCSNRETQFIKFMQGLAAAPPLTPAWALASQEIVVRLTSAGEPIRLEAYEPPIYGCFSEPGVAQRDLTLTFVVPYDGALEFWNVLSTQVLPHLDRMQELREQFERMTGFRYTVKERGEMDYAQTFADLESAARTINQRIAKITPERLANIRYSLAFGYVQNVQIVLRLDGFGADDEVLHPFNVADRTLLNITKHRRATAASGEIVIRD